MPPANADSVHFYTCYGLTVGADTPFPELLHGKPPADVTIYRDDSLVELPRPGNTFFTKTSSEVGWYSRENGWFLIRDGRQIVYRPKGSPAEQPWRTFLLGACMGVLLHQRGYLVLHASALAVNGGIVGFMGGSGWGKSTIAAALYRAGYLVVSDDFIPLKGSRGAALLAPPGFPRLKLWPDVLLAIGDRPEMLDRVHPHYEKRSWPTSRSGFSLQPLPLHRLYVLADSDVDPPVVEALGPQEAFAELVRHSFTAKLLRQTGAAPDHLQQCGKVLRKVPVRRLKRRRTLSQLELLPQIIEKDLAHG